VDICPKQYLSSTCYIIRCLYIALRIAINTCTNERTHTRKHAHTHTDMHAHLPLTKYIVHTICPCDAMAIGQ